MNTDTTTASKPEIWINTTPVEDDYHSRMSTHSDDTEYSIVTGTHSSIHTTVSTSMDTVRQDDLKHQYQQQPERVPDIAREMEKWYAMTDRYGFLHDNYQADEKSKEKEVERAEKWAKMSNSIVIQEEHIHNFMYTAKFKKRVFKGIPDCWRRDAWYFMITDCLTTAMKDNTIRQTYEDLLKKDSIHERQIDLDIPRTLGDHIMFKQRYGSGQRALFNVLRAFANYDEEVGYCQGMTNIVATILMYCEEERAFIVLIHMFMRDHLHNLYVPGFPTLMESFYIQEALLQRYMPKLYHHLIELGLSSDMYGTRWYITLFSGGVVNYHTLLRIWDAYFLCGYDIFFFVAISLLKEYEERLLRSDLEGCMQILGSTMSVSSDDVFMKQIEKLSDKEKKYGIVRRLKLKYQSMQN